MKSSIMLINSQTVYKITIINGKSRFIILHLVFTVFIRDYLNMLVYRKTIYDAIFRRNRVVKHDPHRSCISSIYSIFIRSMHLSISEYRTQFHWIKLLIVRNSSLVAFPSPFYSLGSHLKSVWLRKASV